MLALDPVSSSLIRKFLKDNEEFTEWFEKQVNLIAALGLALYLQTKVG